jgi:hypothetical protein
MTNSPQLVTFDSNAWETCSLQMMNVMPRSVLP